MIPANWQVVIDDTNPQINYSAGWYKYPTGSPDVGTYGPTYNHTSHATNGNDSMSFKFVGRSITVFGTTVIAHLPDNRQDPIWECLVDNVNIKVSGGGAKENNVVICQNLALEDGEHELIIRVTSLGTTFWFDWLTFHPSSQTKFEGDSVFIVESSDDTVQLTGKWFNWADVSNMTSEHNSQARFNFVGTGVTLVSNFPTGSTPSLVAISIDNGTEDNVWVTGVAEHTPVLFRNSIYSTPLLENREHSMLLTYKGSSSVPLVLDYLLVTSSSPSATATSPALPGASTTSSATSSASSSTNRSGTPIGAIVGPVVGALVVIVIILLLLVVLHCKARPSRTSNAASTDIRSRRNNIGLDPFTAMHSTVDPSASRHPLTSTHKPSINSEIIIGASEVTAQSSAGLLQSSSPNARMHPVSNSSVPIRQYNNEVGTSGAWAPHVEDSPPEYS